MGTLDRLLGTWQADMKRWLEVEPGLNSMLARVAFRYIVTDVTVTFTEDTLTIAGYGAGAPKVFQHQVASDDGNILRLDVTRGERKGVYLVEMVDEDHILLKLIEPKNDIMALKRARWLSPKP